MTLSIVPIPVKRAKHWVRNTHRRLPEMAGGMWAVGALQDDDLVGVAVVGRPKARMADAAGKNAPQPNLEVLRVASLEGIQSASGHKGVNSMLYGACARAARGMGARNLFTYIHADEPGTSLRAANWVCLGKAGGGEWDRDARPRQTVIDSEAKLVWFAPWSEKVRAHATAATASPISVVQPSPSAESGGSGALATGDTARTAWGGLPSDSSIAMAERGGGDELHLAASDEPCKAKGADNAAGADLRPAPAAGPAGGRSASPAKSAPNQKRLDIRIVGADGAESQWEPAC